MKYYEIRKLLQAEPDADIYIVIGQRANGKSTSIAKYLIDEHQENGSMFAYFTRLANISIAKDMDEGNGYFTGFLEDYAKEKYHKAFSVKDNEILLGDESICKQFALSLSGKYKSKQYSDKYKYVVFEEFVAEDGVYIRNEWIRFNSVISTITRNRGCKVFLIGNTVSRFNPYFEKLSIDVTNLNIKAGEHRRIETDEGAVVVIEMCDNVYQDSNEIANVLKVAENTIATSTDWIQNKMILSNNDIIDLFGCYKAVPMCILALQNKAKQDVDFYVLFNLINKNTAEFVSNIIVDRWPAEFDEEIIKLDRLDYCFYLDVAPVECLKHQVKSYVDLQSFIKKSEDGFKRIQLPTYYSNDEISHNYIKKINFTDPVDRINERY